MGQGATRKAVNWVLREARLEITLALRGLLLTPTLNEESDAVACLHPIARALAKEAVRTTAATGN